MSELSYHFNEIKNPPRPNFTLVQLQIKMESFVLRSIYDPLDIVARLMPASSNLN